MKLQPYIVEEKQKSPDTGVLGTAALGTPLAEYACCKCEQEGGGGKEVAVLVNNARATLSIFIRIFFSLKFSKFHPVLRFIPLELSKLAQFSQNLFHPKPLVGRRSSFRRLSGN